MTFPLRIAHVQPMSLDLFGHDDRQLGGDVRYSVSNLAAAQARIGDLPTVHLFSAAGQHAQTFDGVEAVFHSCYEPPRLFTHGDRFARQFGWGIVKSLRRQGVDVVHFHGARQFHLMLAPVAWWTSRQQIPLLVQERGYRTVGQIETAAQTYGLRRAAAVLPASEEGLRALSLLGVPPDKLHIVPNGFDEKAFYPDPSRGGPSRPRRLLVVSRLSPEKDPLTMVAGVCEYVGRGNEVSLTVISGGPLRDEVEARLRTGGVQASFVDHVSQPILGDFYRSSDALILTSPVSGSPQVVLEAMACGLPVIATNVAGVRKHVGDAGLLVPIRDGHAVADALERLLGDNALWLRARQAALANVEGFTWQAIAGRLRAIYKRVMNSSATMHQAVSRATPCR